MNFTSGTACVLDLLKTPSYTSYITHPRRAVGSEAVRETLRPFA
jgi:hypothetical protein